MQWGEKFIADNSSIKNIFKNPHYVTQLQLKGSIINTEQANSLQSLPMPTGIRNKKTF